jgi:hypothetical protein
VCPIVGISLGGLCTTIADVIPLVVYDVVEPLVLKRHVMMMALAGSLNVCFILSSCVAYELVTRSDGGAPVEMAFFLMIVAGL